jgi:hypothetical protein
MTVVPTREGSIGACRDCAERIERVQGWKITLGDDVIIGPDLTATGRIVAEFWRKRGVAIA